MKKLIVQRGAVGVHPCACCGGATRSLHGFVMLGSERRALYLAEHTPEHTAHEPAIDVALGLPDGATVGVRVLRRDDGEIELRVLERGEVTWHPAEMLGNWLDRGQARLRRMEVKLLVERILLGDERLFPLVDAPPPTKREGRAA